MPESIKTQFGFISFLHLLIIIAIYGSPFFLDWKLISVCILLYYLQLIFIGDCILTKKEFHTTKRELTFYYIYLTKLGLKLNKTKVRNFVDYIAPWIVLSVALVYQLILGNQVAIRL